MKKIRGQVVLPIEDRLKAGSQIDPVSGCWNWIKGRNEKGYGIINVGSRTDGTRKREGAHRASFRAFKGEIPAGTEVCHHCDNPPCINPEHLFAGTRQQNVDDREQKGRNNHVLGSRVGTAKLDEKAVMEIRKLRASGKSASQVAAIYGVDKSTIKRASNGTQWAHVKAAPPAPVVTPTQQEPK